LAQCYGYADGSGGVCVIKSKKGSNSIEVDNHNFFATIYSKGWRLVASTSDDGGHHFYFEK